MPRALRSTSGVPDGGHNSSASRTSVGKFVNGGTEGIDGNCRSKAATLNLRSCRPQGLAQFTVGDYASRPLHERADYPKEGDNEPLAEDGHRQTHRWHAGRLSVFRTQNLHTCSLYIPYSG